MRLRVPLQPATARQRSVCRVLQASSARGAAQRWLAAPLGTFAPPEVRQGRKYRVGSGTFARPGLRLRSRAPREHTGAPQTWALRHAPRRARVATTAQSAPQPPSRAQRERMALRWEWVPHVAPGIAALVITALRGRPARPRRHVVLALDALLDRVPQHPVRAAPATRVLGRIQRAAREPRRRVGCALLAPTAVVAALCLLLAPARAARTVLPVHPRPVASCVCRGVFALVA